MKYVDGQEVQLGDKVRLGDRAGGVVVASIDTDEYTPEHPKTEWEYLKRGVMVKFPEYGLIHYEEAEPDLALVERSRLAFD
jgi:hypothetical protein